VMFGHIGGVPFEEWLFPVVAMGGTTALAVRATIQRRRDRA
jgi:hypothetical protein